MPDLYRRADVFCAPSLGSGDRRGGAARGHGLRRGRRGLAAARLRRGRPRRRRRPAGAAAAAAGARRRPAPPAGRSSARRAPGAARGCARVRRYDWERVAGEIESVYERVAGRRRQPLPRRRRQQRELFADFHIHTHHSKDCVMPVADILERAREVGLDVVAITDHDTVAGGLEAREIADRYGVRVIVGEEVKTSEGEVIGLFLERTIPGGMTFAETIAAIKAAGRHRLRAASVRSPAHDPQSRTCCAPTSPTSTCSRSSTRASPSPAFNELAERFAQRYRIPAAAGSDSHVLPGIGTCSVRHRRLLRAAGLRRGPRREPHRAPPQESASTCSRSSSSRRPSAGPSRGGGQDDSPA